MSDNKNEQNIDISGIVSDLQKTGAHFGYSRTRRHPSVKDYIFGSKNKIDIIDLEKSAATLEKAVEFISGLAKDGKQILIVGTKKEAQKYVEEGAKKAGVPFVIERWIGGTLTNAGEIRKRIGKMEELTDKRSRGALDMYTKKERLLIDREIAKLEKHFAGVAIMKRLPAAVVVIDSNKEEIAVAEANQMKIPVVSLSGTDCDISGVSYPVVLNDSSVSSIELFVGKIAEAYGKSFRRPLEIPAESKAREEKA